MDAFLAAEIDTVPHLEALLIVWRARPRGFDRNALAAQLYLPAANTGQILDDLARRRLLTQAEGRYTYDPAGIAPPNLMEAVEGVYRHELIRISRMIHEKPPAAMRDFARAFRFTRERE